MLHINLKKNIKILFYPRTTDITEATNHNRVSNTQAKKREPSKLNTIKFCDG